MKNTRLNECMLKFLILAQILSKYACTFIVSTSPVLVLLMVCLIDRTGRVRSYNG